MIPAHREGKERLGDRSEFQGCWSYVVRPRNKRAKGKKKMQSTAGSTSHLLLRKQRGKLSKFRKTPLKKTGQSA